MRPRSIEDSPKSASMWPMTSCSTKCVRKRWWMWSMIGEASGSSSRASPSISSAISSPPTPSRMSGSRREGWKNPTPADAVAHERLVDVEMEQPHLGVGDPRDRQPVDADELEERDEREPRGEHR